MLSGPRPGRFGAESAGRGGFRDERQRTLCLAAAVAMRVLCEADPGKPARRHSFRLSPRPLLGAGPGLEAPWPRPLHGVAQQRRHWATLISSVR